MGYTPIFAIAIPIHLPQKKRMHSSMMRTTQFSGHLRGVHAPCAQPSAPSAPPWSTHPCPHTPRLSTPVHIHPLSLTSCPGACWDTHTPSAQVHAGIHQLWTDKHEY